MSRAAMQGILTARARRVIYVSCDIATFARDSRRLLDAGYALRHVEGWICFPTRRTWRDWRCLTWDYR